MENQGSSICFHRFLELLIASLRMKVLDLLIFDFVSPLLFSLLLFLSYFFSLTPDSLFLKTSLSISPKVPSVLHHRTVALGSFPKFRVLSLDEIRISVWNHTVDSFVVGGERDTIPLSIQLQTVYSDSSAGFCTTAAWRLASCFSYECKIKHAREWYDQHIKGFSNSDTKESAGRLLIISLTPAFVAGTSGDPE